MWYVFYNESLVRLLHLEIFLILKESRADARFEYGGGVNLKEDAEV